MKRLCNGTPIDKNISLENKLIQLDDIFNHKKIVTDICFELVKYFMKNGNDDLALQLSRRAFTHDLSKINEDEFYGMAKFATDTDALQDANKQLTSDKQLAINLHWDRNSHHPEYWTDINQITELDIIELACDWQSRSLQFGTDSLEFLKVRQENRFHFPQDVYDKIEYYLKLINEVIKKEP